MFSGDDAGACDLRRRDRQHRQLIDHLGGHVAFDAKRPEAVRGSDLQIRHRLARREARLRPCEAKACRGEHVRERGAGRVDADAEQADARLAHERRGDEPEGRRAEIARHVDVERVEACGALDLDQQAVDSHGRPHRLQHQLGVIPSLDRFDDRSLAFGV